MALGHDVAVQCPKVGEAIERQQEQLGIATTALTRYLSERLPSRYRPYPTWNPHRITSESVLLRV
jgi:hypothetical protein